MELQEKINKRIEQLEKELSELNKDWYKELESGLCENLQKISAELTTVEVCIKELKQLLN